MTMYCFWFSFKAAPRKLLSIVFFVLLVVSSTAETSDDSSFPPALITGIDQFSEEFFNAAFSIIDLFDLSLSPPHPKTTIRF